MSSTAEHARTARHLHHAVGIVLRLPDGPDTVDHGVVKPEGRLVRRDIKISAGVAGHGEMPNSVDAGATLHMVLEGTDFSVGGDTRYNIARLSVPGAEVVGDVAADATRVGAVAVRSRVLGRCWLGNRGHRTEVDGHAFSITRVSQPILKEVPSGVAVSGRTS